jgi:tRNA-binding protein
MSETELQNVTPYQAFQLVEMRIGRVVRVEPNSRAKKPAYKLWIDFGSEIGTKTSSAQIVANYSAQELENRLVVCATNLGTRNIAGFISEVLTMGIDDQKGNVTLLQPSKDVPLGMRVY